MIFLFYICRNGFDYCFIRDQGFQYQLLKLEFLSTNYFSPKITKLLMLGPQAVQDSCLIFIKQIALVAM